jgi:predicted SAM-dependent methyltransferase
MKIHLGCWHRNFPDFINVDLCDMPHIHYNSSIDSLPFFSDNSAELIYCSHALEYFDRDDAKNVLREWQRVLKPGGILRIAVPDFDALLKVYYETNDLNKILGPLFGKMQIPTNRGTQSLYHKTVYNFESLQSLLTDIGFVKPELWDWRNTEHSTFDDHSQAYFPHMDKENGVLISLNLQAYKL